MMNFDLDNVFVNLKYKTYVAVIWFSFQFILILLSSAYFKVYGYIFSSSFLTVLSFVNNWYTLYLTYWQFLLMSVQVRMLNKTYSRYKVLFLHVETQSLRSWARYCRELFSKSVVKKEMISFSIWCTVIGIVCFD